MDNQPESTLLYKWFWLNRDMVVWLAHNVHTPKDAYF